MQAKKYIIAIDGGSQSSKVSIIDTKGNVICEASEPLKPLSMPIHGHVEHPDDDLWDSLCVASKKAFAKFVGNKEDIIGVGLCTIRYCRALLREDGSLASPVMSWMDIRVSKIHEPREDVKYVTTSSGYITHRFTGNFHDTVANYLGCWPLDTEKWEWLDDKEIAKFNLNRKMLFKLFMPSEIVGYVTDSASSATGIPKNLPVITTSNDKAVEALGAGVIDDGALLVSLGTYIGSMTAGDKVSQNPNVWTNLSCIPYKYLYESGGIRRGMWTVSWFKQLLGQDLTIKAQKLGISEEEFLNLEGAKVPACSNGLITILDWLSPTDKQYKKGMMIGFDARHDFAHMYRSILEGIALTMKNHAEYMFKELNKPIKRLVISGGGANSNLFMQIFADTFNLPASRNEITGSAALGSAICVAIALGVYNSFENAVENMVKIKDTFTPMEDYAEIYDKFNNKVYKNVTSKTDDILKASFDVLNKR